MIWKIRRTVISLDSPLLMGIINITPDSFSDGGHFYSPHQAVEQGLKLLSEGADLLDLGAESTRPGAFSIDEDEELVRLLPVLRSLRSQTSIPISIDTTKASVARACLDEGADIINDVSGLNVSGESMAKAVLDFDAGLILMHRRGTPETMQSLTQYSDVVRDVLSELGQSAERAMNSGIERDRIALDPGLGFAKTAEQNFEILRRISEFYQFGFPWVIGPSRKSFLGKVTGSPPEDRKIETAAAVAYCAFHGSAVFRVHDVRVIKNTLAVIQSIQGVKHVRT